jgi:hypothetical protein
MAQKYPIGIQNFEALRTGNFVYADKTVYINKVVSGSKYFFLSRPRRFGKSLFVSTLEALFTGKKELFDNLYIQDKWNWEEKNPVIKISFSNIDHRELGLSVAIKGELRRLAKQFGIELEAYSNGLMFRELIERVSEERGKVVVLIDEYDKPIIDYLGKEKDNEIAIENREILKGFYGVLKDADPYLRLVFITGVSKFSRVSIFSDLNNLDDITIDHRFGGICGITQLELENSFKEELKTIDVNEIKKWYNGYYWDLSIGVYNPFSLLNFFIKGDYKNYWFETGTPTFLINLSKKMHLVDFDQVEIAATSLSAYEIENLQLVPLMFQTGYLTIKSYDVETEIYTLSYPNREVRKAFLEILSNSYIQSNSQQGVILALQIRTALQNADIDKVHQIFDTLFKSIPYELWQKENEHFYHAIIHLTFKLLGIYVDSQVQTSDGRMDALVRIEKYVYCFEFKLDESAEKALQQIETKGYLTPYLLENKTCIAIGVNFSREEKKVKELLWKKYN